VDDALAHGLQVGRGRRDAGLAAASHEAERRCCRAGHAARHGGVHKQGRGRACCCRMLLLLVVLLLLLIGRLPRGSHCR
jgi:hypothetical protein